MNRASKKPHVLVVEDEDAFRDTAVFVLESEGFRVSSAASTEDALTVLAGVQRLSRPADLLLIDLDMPPDYTKALIIELRRFGILIPILGMIGLKDDAVVREMGKAGKLHLLAKPITPIMLVAAVKDILGWGQRRGAKRTETAPRKAMAQDTLKKNGERISTLGGNPNAKK